MNIFVNGKDVETSAQRLRSIIESLGYQCNKVVVAVNREFVERKVWDEFQIRDGDQLDVLSPIEGG